MKGANCKLRLSFKYYYFVPKCSDLSTVRSLPQCFLPTLTCKLIVFWQGGVKIWKKEVASSCLAMATGPHLYGIKTTFSVTKLFSIAFRAEKCAKSRIISGFFPDPWLGTHASTMAWDVPYILGDRADFCKWRKRGCQYVCFGRKKGLLFFESANH